MKIFHPCVFVCKGYFCNVLRKVLELDCTSSDNVRLEEIKELCIYWFLTQAICFNMHGVCFAIFGWRNSRRKYSHTRSQHNLYSAFSEHNFAVFQIRMESSPQCCRRGSAEGNAIHWIDRHSRYVRLLHAQLEKLLSSDCRAVFLLFPCLGLFMLNQTAGGLLRFSGSYCKACCGKFYLWHFLYPRCSESWQTIWKISHLCTYRV